MDKVGRNDPCPCGSGKKFKKCCERQMIKGRFLASKAIPKKTKNLSSFFHHKTTTTTPFSLKGRVQSSQKPSEKVPEPEAEKKEERVEDKE